MLSQWKLERHWIRDSTRTEIERSWRKETGNGGCSLADREHKGDIVGWDLGVVSCPKVYCCLVLLSVWVFSFASEASPSLSTVCGGISDYIAYTPDYTSAAFQNRLRSNYKNI